MNANLLGDFRLPQPLAEQSSGFHAPPLQCLKVSLLSSWVSLVPTMPQNPKRAIVLYDSQQAVMDFIL
jgi:hypothetical protein